MDSVDRSWTGVPAWPAAWMSAASPRFARWRWPERHCGACLVQMCPPLLAGEVFRTRWHETELLSEDGRASAGRHGSGEA